MRKLSRSEKVLEIDKIKDQLKEFTASSLAKDLVDKMRIFKNLEEVKRAQSETAEAVNLLVKRANPPLYGISQIKAHLKHTLLGGSLGPAPLLRIAESLRVSAALKKYMLKDDSDRQSSYPIVSNLIDSLYTNRSLYEEISSAIISEEEIADGASANLRSIRTKIKMKKQAIKDKLDSLLASEDFKKNLQDDIVTVREGRYVVPVKQEAKSRVKGLVHDMSASGQTYYIEPLALVNMNNDLRSLYLDEDKEIKKILEDLSVLVAESANEMICNEDTLKEIDFIFAKAKLALNMDANKPILNDKGYINLKKARHPLLDKKTVVPIDLYIGSDFTSLIITGPNTGGKTVCLKTVGLLCLMNQMGLHVPALAGSSLGIFDYIFADIGDEQSIEQSLSTFSSHMVNIVDIINRANSASLVLFDELGAGTDPTEGAALARAIMELMLRKKIRCISTTHYNQLKIYALTTSGVCNASMEFDIETLSPTYRLSIGVPGKSNAFEISKRLGLKEDIIKEARALVDEDHMEFEEVLRTIEKDKQEISANKEKIIRQREDLEVQNKRLEKKIAALEAREEKIIANAKDEAKRILNKAKEESKLALDEIKDIKNLMDSKTSRRLQEAQDLIREGIEKVSDQSEKIILEKVAKADQKIKVGDSVKIKSLGQDAIVLEEADKNKEVMVQVGIMKMKVPAASLIKTDCPLEENKNKSAQILRQKSQNISNEIDLRGMNFEEARVQVDKYLDDAYLSGLKRVRLIHGKGTGILRERLKLYLPKLKIVKSIEEAPFDDGGSGVTYVNLK